MVEKEGSLPTNTGTSSNTIPPEYDAPWKEAIELYFPEFMNFFFPSVFKKIAWNEGYTFMDKELEKITKDSEIGRRLADKLVKVWKKDDQVAWVLIHIEVQSNREADFAERIYIYRHRIWERYQLDVASLVILTDAETNYRPNTYKKSLWGTELRFKFPIVKLLDYAVNWEKLEKNSNPFAIVTMAQIKAKTVKEEAQRKAWKVHLVKMLFQRGYAKQTILELFNFIDWLVKLPEDLELQFSQEIEEFEEENKMRYMNTIERQGFEKGILQGKAEGKAEGVMEGKAEGKMEGLREKTIEMVKAMKQEGLPLPTIVKISGLPLEEVETL